MVTKIPEARPLGFWYLALALGEEGIMVGTKSACRENDDGDSHVLVALRQAEKMSRSDLDSKDRETPPAQGIRISLGRENTTSDVSAILDALVKALPLAQESRTLTL